MLVMFLEIIRALVCLSLVILSAVILLPIIAQVVKFIIKNPLQVIKAAIFTAVGYIMLLGGMVIIDSLRQAFNI